MINVTRLKKLKIGQSASKLLREPVMPLNPYFNAYFGDGCLNKSKNMINYRMDFAGTNEELIKAKHLIFNHLNPTQIKKKAQSEKAFGSYVKTSSTSHNDVEDSILEMGDTGNCEDIVRTCGKP